jgi:Domain of unknown function (DUF397)
MRWRKSSYSGSEGGQCVELADTLTAVRDSKNSAGPVLRVDVRELIGAIKAGRFEVGTRVRGCGWRPAAGGGSWTPPC